MVWCLAQLDLSDPSPFTEWMDPLGILVREEKKISAASCKIKHIKIWRCDQRINSCLFQDTLKRRFTYLYRSNVKDGAKFYVSVEN